MKIISGGQTGVDRAALDVALKQRISCGGWCPAGRLDESGKIPERYPLKELKRGGPEERTSRNVQDSDGTVVIYFHELEGGTAYTVGCCIEDRQPYRLIDAAKYSPEDAATLMVSFARDHDNKEEQKEHDIAFESHGFEELMIHFGPGLGEHRRLEKLIK